MKIYFHIFLFFNDTATTEIYTLSLHDALPISLLALEIVLGIDNVIFISILVDKLPPERQALARRLGLGMALVMRVILDRKSTRLNSSHANISYAVFCLKKKKLL